MYPPGCYQSISDLFDYINIYTHIFNRQVDRQTDNVPSMCTHMMYLGTHIAGTNEPKSAQQVKLEA